MNTESFAIVGLTLIGLALPAMGAWFYQVFALKRELSDLERRTNREIERIERDQSSLLSTMQRLSDDMHLFEARNAGRLSVIEKQLDGLTPSP